MSKDGQALNEKAEQFTQFVIRVSKCNQTNYQLSGAKSLSFPVLDFRTILRPLVIRAQNYSQDLSALLESRETKRKGKKTETRATRKGTFS
jgi:hypothetical protein